ncbi:MAG TPA: hypothetical protein VFE05_04505, partial [Longimicrobiaceae bacterium]|nr:hypothetical protein [Longimicrobiaceae bacterium]
MDEREHAVRGLSEDLQIAFASATLAFELRQMVHRHGPLVRLAEDFTWFALRAARDTAVIHLWKVYDTQKQARSLRWFLSRFSKAGPSDRDRDMQRISPSSADVNRLMRLRHQVFAHRGHEAAVKGSAAILESNDLTAPEVFELIQVAR